MARKLPALQRALDAPALFSVAYGEVASSIYFALGVVALHALGLTPWVLLAVGVLLVLVSLSYSEATAAIPEAGGSANVARRAFNDLVGFVAGWVTFLDYLLVLAISALFLPHYLGVAIHVDALLRRPWDAITAVGVIAGVAALRIARGAGRFRIGVLVPVVDVVTQLLLIVLGFAFLFSTDVLTRGIHLGVAPSWHAIIFALPLGVLAYTGLETVANLARDAKRPEDMPRSVIPALALVAVVYVLIGWVALAAFPPQAGKTALGDTWLHAPLVGIVVALEPHLPHLLVEVLRVFVGLSGALILFMAATTSVSGFARLAQSLGEHGQLPRVFARVSRRSLVPPAAILAAAAIAIGFVVYATTRDDDVEFLASLFSFGVLLAFTTTQLAVVRLRFTEPLLDRPFRIPLGVRWRGVEVPLPALLGATLTFAVWIAAMATHPAARYAGPAWLAIGLVLYVRVRRQLGEGLLERAVVVAEKWSGEGRYSRILVPAKLGLIGEEMVATAVRLAQEGAVVEALHVIRVPLEFSLDAELHAAEDQAEASLAEAKLLGTENGVEVDCRTVRARSIGAAIVQAATESGADLIVMGSAPRWRRQSRFFSPTVEYVLREAPCEVLVVAFPQGVVEEETRDA